MLKRKWTTAATAVAWMVVFSVGSASNSYAAGKKPQQPPSNGGCNPNDPVNVVTPNPVRRAVLRPVSTKAFTLPNGNRVDLSADLDLIFNTSVTGSNAFSPTDPLGGSGDDLCGHRIEIRGGVSSLVLDAFEFGLSFGYTPSGDSGSFAGLNGKTKVRVGTIAMDFSVWECTAGTCSAIAASTASALTAGVNLSLEIDFSVVKTGPELVYNTPLGGILRGIMNDGMKQLAASSRLSELSWTARVREYLPETGTLIFDAGSKDHLQANQSFAIYAVTDAVGICNVFKTVAHVHTTQVDPISSTAVVDKVLDSRGIKDGDLVMVRPVASVNARK